MTTNKFFMAASVAAIAVASVTAPVSAESVHSFTDVGSTYDEAVSFLYELEIIKGKSPTQFGTHQQLTRGDAAVILANAIGVDVDGAPDAGFTDLNDRVRGAVNGLAEWGVVSGVTETQFKPNEPLSRGAMAKLLVLGFELEGYEMETPFTDVGGVFAPYIEALYGTEITSGKTATSYGTYANITRGEFANLLYKSFLFMFENVYDVTVESAELRSSTSVDLLLSEAVPEDFSAHDIGEFFYYTAEFEDGTVADFIPTVYKLSTDRLTLTVEHRNFDLSGKAGILYIEDFVNGISLPFNFIEETAIIDSPAVSDQIGDLPEELPATEETVE
ncbi:S-layer homology domain-containing protein [Planococcus salinus]|uniref:S-layer homology domain-containing protein n=1 Tax=Planococcus salinus TaxID=1848460 RepID=A0A3M8PAZ1_9BACL|nr:S-layer homology domain-containing protein [Planococcus salinus]RNF40833.1 S-layer homology domain-containing protein [Planococcus salinus]